MNESKNLPRNVPQTPLMLAKQKQRLSILLSLMPMSYFPTVKQVLVYNLTVHIY